MHNGYGLIGGEALVAVHHCYEVVGGGEADDVVGVAREHVHGLNFVAAYLEVEYFVRADAALLNQAFASNHDKEFPLGIVPMLTLGDAGF